MRAGHGSSSLWQRQGSGSERARRGPNPARQNGPGGLNAGLARQWAGETSESRWRGCHRTDWAAGRSCQAPRRPWAHEKRIRATGTRAWRLGGAGRGQVIVGVEFFHGVKADESFDLDILP